MFNEKGLAPHAIHVFNLFLQIKTSESQGHAMQLVMEANKIHMASLEIASTRRYTVELKKQLEQLRARLQQQQHS